jgi:hypothetical protein
MGRKKSSRLKFDVGARSAGCTKLFFSDLTEPSEAGQMLWHDIDAIACFAVNGAGG